MDCEPSSYWKACKRVLTYSSVYRRCFYVEISNILEIKSKKANAPVNNFLMCSVRECTKIMIRKVFERVSTDNSRGWMHDQNTFDGLFIQLLWKREFYQDKWIVIGLSRLDTSPFMWHMPIYRVIGYLSEVIYIALQA